MNFVKLYGAQAFGPFLFLIIYFMPTTLEPTQQKFLAIFYLVVFGWLFTKIPLYVTGFVGVGLSVLLNIGKPVEIFANFGHPIIFLFLAGFLLAKAFNNVGLDKRISLYLLTRPFIKGSFTRLVFTLMALTTVFTMWISNTATTAMMLPLVLGVLDSLKIQSRKLISFILISIAYASSIGGIATPIGSTPNIIALGMLEEFIDLKISFLEWMAYSLPISIIFLGTLLILTRRQIKKENIKFDNAFLVNQYQSLPYISKAEISTGIIFLATIFFWMLPSFLKLAGISTSFNFNTGGVGIFFASFLFLFPAGENKILKSSDIKTIDWSSLMLFGSGLAFGKILFDLGLAQMAGDFLTSAVSGLPILITFIFVFGFVIFSTELTSNTATANILIPIMISLAGSLNISPFFFSLGVALSCSLAFMLPVATPPNAIVYGSERVFKGDMIKFGFGLNVIFTILLALIIYFYQSVFG
jgi:sodium-dependent dicarboxylate transporter 2/3/5